LNPQKVEGSESPGGRYQLAVEWGALLSPCFVKVIMLFFVVMPGHCPGHPRLKSVATRKTWMAGTSPAMTVLLFKQRIHIDIDLPRRPDVADFETVGLEAVFQEADFLDADHFLFLVGNDEAG
jgi:hypothetical protein